MNNIKQTKQLEYQKLERHLKACTNLFEELAAHEYPPQKTNVLLDSFMNQIEIACISMRKIVEHVRPRIPAWKPGSTTFHAKTIYGNVILLDNGWLHVHLNTLLPHYKILGGTQYIEDSITRLLHTFTADGGQLPFFDRAFLVVEEHCDVSCCEAFDADNKGYKAVINALKGRVFADDNQFELSLGLFTVCEPANCCDIYVLPYESVPEFFYWRQSL